MLTYSTTDIFNMSDMSGFIWRLWSLAEISHWGDTKMIFIIPAVRVKWTSVWSASDLWQSSLETFSRFPFSSFAFLKLILYFFQLEKSLDGFSRTWIMIKQSIRVLKCVNSLRGGWLSYKCITLFIPDSWFWQDSISQGFILCNFIT